MDTVSTINQLAASLSGSGVADHAVLSELALLARTNPLALRIVAENFPRPFPGRADCLAEMRIRDDLAQTLACSVPGLIEILESLHDPSNTTREQILSAQFLAEKAAEILRTIGERASAAVPALIRAMHADPRNVGVFAGLALGGIGSEEAIRELNRVWFSGWDRKLCESCPQSLIELGDRAHPVLLRIVGEPDYLNRARALHSLRAAGYPEHSLFVLALALLSSDPSEVVQNVAVKIFDSFDAPAEVARVLPELRKVADDVTRPQSIRATASKVLEGVNDKLARRVLLPGS